jgi:hypothetical protein
MKETIMEHKDPGLGDGAIDQQGRPGSNLDQRIAAGKLTPAQLVHQNMPAVDQNADTIELTPVVAIGPEPLPPAS